MLEAVMNSKRSVLVLSLLALLFLPAGGALAAAQLTAAVGTTSGDDALEGRGGVADGEDLETTEDGGCSVLVDGDALMEVCGNTSLQLSRKGGASDGSRVVKLDRGAIRMVVEPRLGEEKIEIHTPAAIATVLGTILHVAVDANGVTTITSEVSRVLVESANPSVQGKTTLDGGQQIVIQPGQAPPKRPVELSRQKAGGLGGCLLDFRAAALRSDRAAAARLEIDATVADDVAVASLPQVTAELFLEPQVSATVDDLPDPASKEPFPTAEKLPNPQAAGTVDTQLPVLNSCPTPGIC